MKQSRVVVPWPEGLHLRAAAKLARAAQRFRSSISLKCGERIADVGSILSVIALCATMGTALDVEVAGEDEQDAAQAVEQAFSPHAETDSPYNAPPQRF
ncbi:MAG TPA: HPr family phosphocarrier protein [Opitutaceae bacterium]|nr:HPr family phosphocarrier protein [Opitutaceae bacterium]